MPLGRDGTDEPEEFCPPAPKPGYRLRIKLNSNSSAWRPFAADTLALISFFTVTGVLNERFVAGMTWDQVFDTRVLGAVIMVPSGRPYGVWRDWFMKHAKRTHISQLLWDTFALVSFQVPIYAAILLFSGAAVEQVLRGSLGVIAIMLVAGRPYGSYLNLIRRYFDLEPGGQKTMSLNK